jgi:N-acetylglucosamine-6-phosphate deacetylase
MIVRGTLLGDGHASDIDVREGRIHAITSATRRRVETGSHDSHILPLLFDIQVNGYAGIDLQSPTLQPEDVARLDEALGRTGVGYWIPTIITNSQRRMERSCRVIAEALQYKHLARRIPGIHLEGPYLSSEDGPRGAHARRHIRPPSIREFDRCIEAAEGRIVYTTIAPEQRNAIPFIRHAVREGVVVSLGHHNANADQIARAADAGATMVTHLGNGIAPTLDRHHNPIWPQLADDRLTCSVITDLQHVPAPMLRAITNAKGKRRIILTSDAVHIAGLKPGKHKLADVPVTLGRDGVVRLTGTQLLAGSATPLIQGIFNTVSTTGMSLTDAIRSATTIPARLLGTKNRFTKPRVGTRAQFVVCRQRQNGRVKIEAVFRD